jgi:two-component system, response regulator PdtaR
MAASPVVLVVEDNVLVRMTLHEGFEDAGFHVLEAGTADEAKIVISARPDVLAVVSDVEMEGPMNGFDLAWAIKRESPATVVILVSGRSFPSSDTLPPGVTFHQKPFVIDEIVEEVREAIHQIWR